jgi:hypothetical protein
VGLICCGRSRIENLAVFVRAPNFVGLVALFHAFFCWHRQPGQIERLSRMQQHTFESGMLRREFLDLERDAFATAI